MLVPNMKTLAQSLVLTGAFAAGVNAIGPYSDKTRTETASPQELGSMTVDGLYVYTMNYCTIVQTTDCAISLTTGGPVPKTPATPVPTGDETSFGLGSDTTTATTGISVPATETAGDGNPTLTHDHEAPPTDSTTSGATVVDTAQAAILGVAGIAMAFL